MVRAVSDTTRGASLSVRDRWLLQVMSDAHQPPGYRHEVNWGCWVSANWPPSVCPEWDLNMAEMTPNVLKLGSNAHFTGPRFWSPNFLCLADFESSASPAVTVQWPVAPQVRQVNPILCPQFPVDPLGCSKVVCFFAQNHHLGIGAENKKKVRTKSVHRFRGDQS